MLKQRFAVFGVLLLAIALLLVPLGMAQDDGEITCSTTGDELEGDAGDLLTVVCPADCTSGIVWGTGVYTDDSAVCTAAIHAGVLTSDGGEVEVFILEGEESYEASEANGILSSTWGSWDRSFGFGTLPKDDVIEFTCFDTTIEGAQAGEVYTGSCPSGCEAGSIWGTGVYTDDSNICTAAAHAGAIDLEEGGEFTIVYLGGQESYPASEQNGIESSEWDSWHISFAFSNNVECSTAANEFEGDVGATGLITCPSACEAAATWGTDIYTDDSSLCTAAAHAGVIDLEEGGTFIVTIAEGQEEYQGSEQNDISTADWGAWERSFVVSPIDNQLLTCDANAYSLGGEVGDEFTVTCPASCDAGTAWGTDIYTADSSICTAAAHAGVIDAQDGGTFVVTLEEGQDEYEGSEENGIESFDYGAWDLSFSVNEE